MAEPTTNVDRELAVLETELKRLEAEYNMFFAGRLPRPPWETRARVDGIVKRLDRLRISNYGDRFRFTTLQARFAAFVDLWDRGLRAREEGRAGPFAAPPRTAAAPPAKPAAGVMHVTTFTDPTREMDKVQDLYESLAEARRQAGQDPIPFHKFADLIRTQVAGLKEKGSPEVAFRVSMKDGKVNFTARAVKGAKK